MTENDALRDEPFSGQVEPGDPIRAHDADSTGSGVIIDQPGDWESRDDDAASPSLDRRIEDSAAQWVPSQEESCGA